MLEARSKLEGDSVEKIVFDTIQEIDGGKFISEMVRGDVEDYYNFIVDKPTPTVLTKSDIKDICMSFVSGFIEEFSPAPIVD